MRNCPWDRMVQQPVGIRKQIHKSPFKDLILTHMFCLLIWKEKTWSFPFLFEPGTTDRDLEESWLW